jgi:putative nucleotidyltransferase with HDIG domain
MLTIDSFLESVDYLPPVPRNLNRLIELLNQDEVAIDRVAELIQYDPAMTAQVMRLCNSVHFGGRAPASDLYEATARVGFNEIYQLVTALSTAALIRPQQKGYGIEAGELWKHCMAAALVGKLIAVDREDNASLVFTACLLHDLGKVVLSRGLEARYDEVLAEAKRSQAPMLVVERSILGFDHPEVGSRLLERWNFPPNLVAAVRFHHDPGPAGEHARLAAYACLSNMVSCFMGYGCGHQALALKARSEALELLGVNAKDIPAYMTRAFYALRDTEALLTFSF